MPLFAALFTAFFSSLGVFLAKLFAAKIAIRVVAVTALTALAAAVVTAFNVAVTPFVGAMFSTSYGQFLGLLFPPISGTVIAALMTFWLLVMTYRLQSRAIALTAGV
jgi:hypothetical protein